MSGIVDKYVNRGSPDEPEGERSQTTPPASDANTSSGSVDTAEQGGLITLPGSVAMMLDLRMRDGTRRALPYGYITELLFQPGDTVTVVSNDHTVVLTGRALKSVYQAIANHSAVAVCESESGFDEGGEGPFIEKIVIEIPTTGTE